MSNIIIRRHKLGSQDAGTSGIHAAFWGFPSFSNCHGNPPKPSFLGVVSVVTHIFLGLKTFRPQIVHGFGVQRYNVYVILTSCWNDNYFLILIQEITLQKTNNISPWE